MTNFFLPRRESKPVSLNLWLNIMPVIRTPKLKASYYAGDVITVENMVI